MEKGRRPEDPVPRPANDNGGDESPGPRVRRIAQAIGHYLAREQIKRMNAANDDDPKR